MAAKRLICFSILESSETGFDNNGAVSRCRHCRVRRGVGPQGLSP
jgi:hypothetical protein